MESAHIKQSSLWREFYQNHVYKELSGDVEVDVAVIGAGITGLTSAYLLMKAGKKVAVLEKDTVGGGTTGRTTGKVTSQHSLMYAELLDSIGRDQLAIYGNANQAAVELINQIVHDENIECDWERDDNFVFTADPKKVDSFKREAEVAASIGLPASFETQLSLPFAISGAVKFAHQGKFASQKYLLGLAQAIHDAGDNIFERSNVTGIQDGSPCRVKTAHGTVTARDVIVATNVPTLPLMARGGYCILEYPTESYIVAGIYPQKLHGMYISPDKHHYSILPITLGAEQRLLIGGGGHLSGLRVSKDIRFNHLLQYAEKQFAMEPDAITHKWSDRDYMAYDKLPLIGKLYPWSKHLYVGTAFKKWGLSGGTMAATILCDMILGNEHPAALLFTPQRSRPIRSIPRNISKQIKQLSSP